MRNVFVTVFGTTPAILTETLWALLNARVPPFIPDELHIITTTEGWKAVERALLGPSGRLEAFFRDFPAAKRLSFPKSIHRIVPTDENGAELADIRDLAASERAATTIAGVVQEITADPDSRLHASIAGGRKTMSFWLGQIMTFFARSQDEMSHTLISPEFEQCPDFFYKLPAGAPRERKNVKHRDGRILDTDNCRIELGPVPLMRLREYVAEPLLQRMPPDLRALQATARAGFLRPTLAFLDASHSIQLGDTRYTMEPQLYAMYRLLAEAWAQQWDGAGPDKVGPGNKGWLYTGDFEGFQARGTKRYLEILKSIPHQPTREEQNIATRIAKYKDDPSQPFREIRSKTQDALKSLIIDPILRHEILIKNERSDRGKGAIKGARFGLTIDPKRIRFEEYSTEADESSSRPVQTGGGYIKVPAEVPIPTAPTSRARSSIRKT